MQSTETWRPIPGWEDRYEVSDAGRVRSLDCIIVNQFQVPYRREGKVRALWTDPKGYRHATLYRANVGKRFSVHRLVMLAFRGECPEGHMVCHENGDPSDNRLANLRYGTNSSNQLDRAKHGTHARGTRSVTNRHSEDDIRAMRALYSSGRYSQREIGNMYGIRQAAVSAIVNRRVWAWLT